MEYSVCVVKVQSSENNEETEKTKAVKQKWNDDISNTCDVTRIIPWFTLAVLKTFNNMLYCYYFFWSFGGLC